MLLLKKEQREQGVTVWTADGDRLEMSDPLNEAFLEDVRGSLSREDFVQFQPFVMWRMVDGEADVAEDAVLVQVDSYYARYAELSLVVPIGGSSPLTPVAESKDADDKPEPPYTLWKGVRVLRELIGGAASAINWQPVVALPGGTSRFVRIPCWGATWIRGTERDTRQAIFGTFGKKKRACGLLLEERPEKATGIGIGWAKIPMEWCQTAPEYCSWVRFEFSLPWLQEEANAHVFELKTAQITKNDGFAQSGAMQDGKTWKESSTFQECLELRTPDNKEYVLARATELGWSFESSVFRADDMADDNRDNW